MLNVMCRRIGIIIMKKLFFILSISLTLLGNAKANDNQLTIEAAVNIFGDNYVINETETIKYTWLFNINSLENQYPPPMPRGSLVPVPYMDMKIKQCYLTIETDKRLIINTQLSGSGCIEFKLQEKYIQFKALFFPSSHISKFISAKTHNKRINPFATAHSDRHNAAAVYAKR